ncbi:BTAD domain-containing putative transcriptional regulator [Angustibacter luteus]|uniref:BTAD domain-containing putative transcriptional regulator n=1 Tax=Angustibacter luteus TaxID=658456 RepID=A0ABW1JJG1_9ACTN
MQIGYLGPLEVHDGERLVVVPGVRLRRLLGRLVLDVGRAVSPRALTDAVWPDDVPADPVNALQSLVSRLRRALGDGRLIEQTPAGYRLALAPQDVDAVRFSRLATAGRDALRRGADDEAAVTLREALALWRGEVMSGDDDPDLESTRARFAELRLQVLADRLEADVRLGRAAEVVAELEELTAAHPLREDLATLQMGVLVDLGRPAEALAVYESTRRFLADTLGSDPSVALQAKHLEVLRGQDAGPPGPRTNLRAAVTSFVGRDEDARRVQTLLAGGSGSTRLVTVVGAGGSGKTRLASEVAATLVDRLPDGVWFAELAPVNDPDSIALAVLDGIGVRDVRLLEQRRAERPPREARNRVLDTLSTAECLLVLDNCEHVIEAAASLVADLLGHCPRVRVIATSREPLGIDGETVYPLTPLALPEASPDPGSPRDEALALLSPAQVEALAAVPSVQLLLDRARAAGAPLRLDADTLPDVVRIVRRLDGLPLAIELAAARLRVLSLAEVADRLTDRFRLLTGGKRTAVPRHRTLRAVVEWSWDLMDPLEREVAEHFSLFGSGATAQAVRAVSPTWRGGEPRPIDLRPDRYDEPELTDVQDVLHALVDKSILVAEPDELGTRFRMLETLREYGSEQLSLHDQMDPARLAHARFYARLTAVADARLRTRDQLVALHVFDVERDNLLAALAYLGDSGDAQASVDLAVRLAWHWTLRESGRDAARWLRFAMAVPGAESTTMFPVAEAMGVVTAFASAGDQPDPPDAQRRLVTLANALDGLESEHQIAPLLRPLLLFIGGEREASMAAMEATLSSPDAWVRAAVRGVRIAFGENEGELEMMRADLPVALAEWEQIGDHWGLAAVLSSSGQLRVLDGDLVGAVEDLEAALGHMRLLGGGSDDLMAHIRLADISLRAGDVARARRFVDAIRSDRRYAELGEMRDLLTTIASGAVAMAEQDEATVDAEYARLTQTLARMGEPSHYQAHGGSYAYAFLALIDVRRAQLDVAAGHVRTAWRLASMTEDLPIMATAGTSVAELGAALGRSHEAAVLLGASAALRGSPDLTQPTVATLTAHLVAELGGDAFEAAFESGRVLDREQARARLDPQLLLGGSTRAPLPESAGDA